MSEKIASYVLEFDGEDGGLRSVFAGIKQRIRDDVRELEQITSKVELFADLSNNLPAVQRAIDSAKDKIATLTAEVQKFKDAGDKAPKSLTDALAAAEKQLSSATREMQRQQQQLATLDTTLTKAGVDTRNLAAEQTRLAAATAAAAEAAAVQAAKQALGLTTLKDIQPQIAQLNTAYQTLQRSGTLSATEITQAHALLQTRISEVEGSVTGMSSSFTTGGGIIQTALGGVLANVLSVGAGLTVLGKGLTEAIEAAHKLETVQAQISTVTDLSQQQFGALTGSVRQLAIEIGVGPTEALRELYETLRSGVPADNALEVLRAGALAAKATMSDFATGTKAANLLVSAFQVDVKDLGAAFDVLVAAQQRGGLTLKEFADNAGALLNVAKAQGVALNDVVAVLTLLRNNGLEAGESISALTKIMTQLGDPDVRAKLRALGIEVTGLSDTIAKIAAKGLGVNEVLELGLASTKSAAAVSTLTNNASSLPNVLEAISNASGTTKAASEKLGDTFEALQKKQTAAKESFVTGLGELIPAEKTWLQVSIDAYSTWGLVLEAIRKTKDEAPPASEFIGRLDANIRALQAAGTSAKQGLDYGSDAMDRLAAKAREASAGVKQLSEQDIAKLYKDLGTLGTQLENDTKALEDATNKRLAAIKQAGDAEIAALDRSVKAQQDTAATTLDIQTRSAKDRLAVIEKSEAEIKDLTDRAAEARRLALEKAKTDTATIEAEIAKLRLASIEPTITQYRALYSELTAQAQSYAAKVQQSEAARVAYSESIEKQLFDIRIGGLSAFDQYIAKSKEADRLISLSREAAAAGDAKNAEKFANEAIAIAKTLGETYSANGAIIVTKGQAQEQQLKTIRSAGEAVNQAYVAQGDAARTGQVLSEVYQGRVYARLIQIELQQDALNAKAAAGLNYKITLDEKSYDDTKAKLDALAAPRTVTVTVNTVQGSAAGGTTGSAPGVFAAGGYVQKLAAGGGIGPIFRPPPWAKVPGVGDSDTVPAALASGSYVIRKQAAQLYGDGAMSRLARGYADGGPVKGAAQFAFFNAIRDLPFAVDDLTKIADAEQASARSSTDADDVIAYAKAVLQSAGNSSAADGVFRYVMQDIQSRIRYVEQHKKDATAIAQLLKSAASMGANLPMIDFYGKTSAPATISHPPLSFEEWAASVGNAANALVQGIGSPLYRASGGNVGDTIPAMLTPGEYVLNPSAVQNVARLFGGGFLDAVNQMRVPGPMLRGLTLAQPPRPQYFAQGGPVGYASGGSVKATPGAAPLIGELHLHGTPADFMSETSVRRFLLPVLRDITKREGKS